MKDNIKLKIYQLPDVIKDEATLNQVMEDVAFYAGKKDIMDELNPEPWNELNIAIREANKIELFPGKILKTKCMIGEKIVITNRFRNNTLCVYQYMLKEFTAKIANHFLDQSKQRMELIVKHPAIGKHS